MKATHYSTDKATACGLVGVPYVTDDPDKVDCLNCRSTRNFPGKRVKCIMKAAHEMAAAGGYGFLGRSGMLSYNERLRLAITHLGRKR